MNNTIVIKCEKKIYVLFFLTMVIIGLIILLRNGLSLLNVTVEISFIIGLVYSIVGEEIKISSEGEGFIESTFFNGLCKQKQSYIGLNNVVKIYALDMGGENNEYKYYLAFSDGFELRLPSDERIPEKLIAWFEDVYNTRLKITIKK